VLCPAELRDKKSGWEDSNLRARAPEARAFGGLKKLHPGMAAPGRIELPFSHRQCGVLPLNDEAVSGISDQKSVIRFIRRVLEPHMQRVPLPPSDY
jgi:hypothetical protein